MTRILRNRTGAYHVDIYACVWVAVLGWLGSDGAVRASIKGRLGQHYVHWT